ncbi:MAG TPA: 3-dehydroquinate synthase [Verrucomicrobiota bacterium]|nr:3-dehydroquinate synthase [Verrucomicrobiota bacterium]HNU49535.1 3-dehydroquinate synthase [Verrucomicrobiota bacterium]
MNSQPSPDPASFAASPARTVTVELGDRRYAIRIGRRLLARLGRECARLDLAPRCALITDRRVGRFHAATAHAALEAAGFEPVVVTVPAGERTKDLRWVRACCDRLAAHRLERSSFVVALGGGVVGDLAGFVAATYLRGISYVQVPTTLLAQVDSSVGGKVGVNLPAGKNLVGAFHQPRLVLADLDTLDTLPSREFRSGLGEVIKYGIIADARLFRRLERDIDRLLARDPRVLAGVIARCCAIKADVVRQDEREGGRRAILNFGHTLGHGLEAIHGYHRYRHGEAIAVGQVLAARLSVDRLGLPEEDAERIRRLFLRAGLPVAVRLRPETAAALLRTIRLDKKVQAGEIRFVLARRLGDAVWGERVPASALEAALSGLAPAKVPCR